MVVPLDIDVEQLEEQLSRKLAAVLFWVRSCSACNKFKPVFNLLPDHLPEVRFLRVNILKTIGNLRYAESHDIEETPTTILYCNGEVHRKIVGTYEFEEIINLIGQTFADCI